jgi:hypothetical protein
MDFSWKDVFSARTNAGRDEPAFYPGPDAGA